MRVILFNPYIVRFLLIAFLSWGFQGLYAQDEPEEEAEELSTEEVKCKPDDFSTIYDKFQSDTLTQRQIQIWYSFGQEEFKHKQYARAIPYYWKVLVNDKTGTYKVLYSKLVSCYFELTKSAPDDASKKAYLDSTLLSAYRGLEKYPDYASLHYHVGTIQRTLGHTQCAIPHYEALTKLAPDEVNYWKALAELYFKAEDEKAISTQQKVVELDPNDVDAQRLLVEIMNFFGKDPIQAMRDAFLSDTTNIPTALRYGTEALVRGQNKEAKRAFQAILVQDPRHVEAMNNLAKSYEGMNRTSDAIKTYKEILAIEPQNVVVLSSLAWDYANLNNFATAKSYINQAKRIDPGYGQPYMVMAEILENAVSYCSNHRTESTTSYDDKLVYELAGAEYAKAARDPNFAAVARQRQNQLKPLFRTPEDIHMQSHRKTIKDDCYSWIK